MPEQVKVKTVLFTCPRLKQKTCLLDGVPRNPNEEVIRADMLKLKSLFIVRLH